MTAAVGKAVEEIRRGKRSPVYLLHGDEFLVREGARALVEALLPPEERTLGLETIGEEAEVATLPSRLATVSLFGGLKVVLVQDNKAFVSKQNAGRFFERSLEAWQDGEADKALRLFLQGVGAAGEGEAFLRQAAQGPLPEAAWGQVLRLERGPEAEGWLGEMAERAGREGQPVPTGAGGTARVYEELLTRGLPAQSVLILTCDVVDERRALYKKLAAAGPVIDCSVRSKRGYDTQMNLDAARAKIRELVGAAGKSLDREAEEYLLERVGLSMRALVAEVEKLLLSVGSRPRIGPADAKRVLSGSREAGVFDLTNAVGERNAQRALTALRSLLIQREPAVMIIGLLANELRQLLLARCLIDQRLEGRFDKEMPYPAFQGRVLPRLKAGPEAGAAEEGRLAEIHPFRLYNLLREAARFVQGELLAGLEAAATADLALKTTGRPEARILEELILRVCAPR